MITSDLGIKKVLGVELTTNIRPDLIVIDKSGTVTLVEVVSKSQTGPKLEQKLEQAKDQLVNQHKAYKDAKFELIVGTPEEIFNKIKKGEL